MTPKFTPLFFLPFFIDLTLTDHHEPAMNILCKGRPEMTYWPLPEDCTKFFVCIDQHTFVMDCPFDLFYDRTRNLCAYPDEVDCSPESPKRPHHTTTRRPMMTHHTTKPMKPMKPTKGKRNMPPQRTTTHRPRTTTVEYPSAEDFSDVIATGVLPRFPGSDSDSHEFENQVECCNFDGSDCYDC